MEKFLYLVQSAGRLPDLYRAIPCQRADLIQLTFEEEIDDAIHLPRSSWTQRRNRLLADAAARGEQYLYYIFLDEGVSFVRGDWRQFEDSLLRYRPAIATPHVVEHPLANHRRQELDAHTSHFLDGTFNAFHAEVARDGILLPYYGGFDREPSSYSHMLVMLLAELLYPRHTLQINSTAINRSPCATPARAGDFRRIERWFHSQVMRPALSNASARHGKLVARHLRSRLLDRRVADDRRPVYAPAPPPASYRIPEIARRRLFNPDSAFWQRPFDPSAASLQAHVFARTKAAVGKNC
jgi:hypothetical protein